MSASNSSRTVWADISYYQRTVTDAYPEPMLSFRADTGGSTDSNARANWAWCEKTARLKVALAYLVLIPGNETAILSRLKNAFGSKAPTTKLAVMIDMESGAGFAGPGNHSSSGNKMDDLLSDWLGNPTRVVGYANAGDWSSCWPSRRSSLKRVVASYGSAYPAGAWAQQYYGGMDYPTPAGLPRSMAPFGSNVDLNVAHRSITQLVADLGLSKPAPADPMEEVMAMYASKAVFEKALRAIVEDVVHDEVVRLTAKDPAKDKNGRAIATIVNEQIDANTPNIAAAVKKALA